MANALQFIESNIEDLEKDDVQKEIARRFVEKCNLEKIQYTQIGQLAKLYSETAHDEKHISYEQMRLTEEILINADHELKVMINANLDHFIQTMKTMSLIKGCRWDDIVLKFEYEIIELPSLLKRLASASIPKDLRD